MFVKPNLDHIDEIVNIENDIFEQPWSRYHFLSDIKKNVSYNIMYLEKSRCVGYIFGYIIENEYHLNNIAVKKNYQKRGIAKKILHYVIEKLKDKNVGKIFLEVRCDNFAAIRLYELFGFEKKNIRKDYYKKGKDAILYNMDIK
tara:strand:+ start:1434 stop:1865 length:432 start_codon:yes stop_codon:yes gene_type:complete